MVVMISTTSPPNLPICAGDRCISENDNGFITQSDESSTAAVVPDVVVLLEQMSTSPGT